MTARDGHVRVLPLHVANKIAAGEVVERPASVVKELVENAIDAGARRIAVSVIQGGRKLVSVQDDGCGMTRDDAVLSLERQATSKILDVDDIEEIDTLGFRGEAIPSIASVSRFSITTRRHDSDEGTAIAVNAGTLAEVRAAGCPPGTLVEVRDLFCNVPARRKFLRSYATEENHVRQIFTVHALAHPAIGFTLSVDGRELYRLAPTLDIRDRIRDLFGEEFLAQLLPMSANREEGGCIRVSGFIERPNPVTPTRRDQYVFVNGRPASAPSIAYALREAFPRHQGDVKPASVLFIELPANQVDVNVHPTKREVRFRDNAAVKRAVIEAVDSAIFHRPASGASEMDGATRSLSVDPAAEVLLEKAPAATLATSAVQRQPASAAPAIASAPDTSQDSSRRTSEPTPLPPPVPTPRDLPLAADGARAAPWNWFKFLAITTSGYLLIETDAGIVTLNPHAARERIAFEKLLATDGAKPVVQSLLIPEVVRLTPSEFARIRISLPAIRDMGFELEEFGNDVFKVEAVPQLIGELPPATILATIARDLADGTGRRIGERWREELIARSVARSFAGAPLHLNEELSVRLVETLAVCRMPYVCPRGKPIMIFTSTRELNRKFSRD